MFRNYLKVAIRNLLKQRAYTVLNITGLGIGIACFILIFLYIYDESSYDRFYSKADRVFRVVTKMDMNGVGERSSSCAFPVGSTLQREFPEAIESSVRFFNGQTQRHLLSAGDKKEYEKRFYFTDSTVFNVFDIQLTEGDRRALNLPNSIIISETTAKKYFGNEDPLGKTITYGGKMPLKVTGVFKDVPQQSHLRFDLLASMSTIKMSYGRNMDSWIWNPCWTYILLKKGFSKEYINERLPGFVRRHLRISEGTSITAWLQPLTSIHLHSDMDYEIEANSSINYIYVLGAIGFFVLIIASINFMNLSTARSSKRAKEIGMRKTLGALRSQIILQFIFESVIMAFISLLLALALVELVMPAFNQFTGKNLSLSALVGGTDILIVLAFGLLLGIVSGIYPAFYMSSFRPIVVLRGIFKPGIRSGRLRQVLVVVQYTLSLSLIACTIIVHCQLHYIRKKDLGFSPENIVLIPIQNTRAAWIYDSLKNEMLKTPYIKSITGIEDIFGAFHNTHEFRPEGYLPDQWYYFPTLVVRDDFFETFQIPVIAGRGFKKDSVKDKFNGVVINESMVHYMGWTSNREALGRKFKSFQGDEHVIGVVKDFHANSLYSSITPFVFNMKELPVEIASYTRYIAVRVDPSHKQEAIDFMKKVWTSFKFEQPFETLYLPAELDKLYANDEKLATLAIVFSLLAIIVASLGLIGLTSYLIESRTREIGVRKVLGITASRIVFLIVRSFIILIIIAGLIAIPLTIVIMKSWFVHFAFHIGIPWWSFVLSLFIVLFIALSTILFQALRASRPNVVEALRTNG